MKGPRETVPDKKIQSPPTGSIGIRAYAKRRTAAGKPISHTAVGKAISSGRLAAAVWRDDRGRPFIDPEKADILFEENTDPAQQREHKAGGRPAEDLGEGLFDEDGPQADSVQTSARSEREQAGLVYNKARTIREGYEAKMAQLKYREAAGELGRVGVMSQRAVEVGIMTRDALRQVPARIAAELEGKTAHEIEERLMDEIDAALTALAELGRPFPV